MPVIKDLGQTSTRGAGEGRRVTDLREREGSPAKTDGNPQAGRGDMVTLTDTAKRLMQFQATLASDPGVDSGKVDRIRQALEDGSYHIDSMNIAGKLLETESKL